MRSSVLSGAAAVLAAAQLVSGQTFTSCNPTTNSSCPSDTALGKSITVDFTKGKSDYFTDAQGTSMSYDATNGANFIMNTEGQAPTITSNFYIFFGTVEVVMQAANGTGVVSSFVMESDDLDEIDWEWLGGDGTQVESNYFGKGNTTTYDRAIYHSVNAPQSGFHTYTIDWSSESIVWSIDGTAVRTLNYADANGGDNFPQTPMVVKMGNWDGGASTESAGTIEWAGGKTDWTTAPFAMYVKSVTITDKQTGATSYTYGDETGSYKSIKISTDAVVSSSAASATASASGSLASKVASATPTSGVSTTGDKTESSASGSIAPTSTIVTPPFQNPAPVSNDTTSSNLTSVSSTPTGSSSSSSSKTSSTSSAASTATGDSSSEAAGSKYGKIDVAVLALGLTLGYFFM